MLTLLTGTFSVLLSLLKVGMLGCAAMNVALSLSDSFGGNQLKMFESRLSLVG
jgi:hypothetical protein